MITVKLLPHQANLVQAPYVFPDIRFFFLLAGYASGKTSALAYAILYTTKLLLGKKDLEGHNPKLLIASKNLTFMKKTLTGILEQDLKETNSVYRYDKAHNIITVGNVQWLLIPDEDESNIYGFCFEGSTLITTLTGDIPIRDVKKGDYVYTTEGFRQVKQAGCTGIRECIRVTIDGNDTICTEGHYFIDAYGNNIQAKDLTSKTDLLRVDGSIAHIESKTEEAVGLFAVYDIEVERCHEFFANGIRVHNSVFASFVDELDELDTQTAVAVVKAINDRTRQTIAGMRTPFVAFTTSAQGLKGTYQTVMHFKKRGMGYVLMRARTRDNIYLDKEYVTNMYAIYNDKERACLLDANFVSIDSGLVFPDYDPAKNKLDLDLYEHCRDKGYTIYIGQDFNGFGNNAVAFAVVDESIVAIKDYEFPDIRRAPEVFRYDFPTNNIIWVPDMTYKEHFAEFKKELRVFNIKIAYRSCNPLVGDRNFACNKLFVSEHLFICPMCKDLETTLLTWQKDPRTGQPNKGGKGAPDHKGDCLGYVVHYLLSWKKELKPLYRVTLERIYSARRARGADATELEVYSTTLDPSKLKGIKLNKATNVDE